MNPDLDFAFREAMSHISSPVTVITTMVAGVPHGSTVSSFASLSVTPPMVVFALDNRGALIDQLREAGCLGINLLSDSQSDVAMRFATRGYPTRFEDSEWFEADGLPRLAGTSAWLRCDQLEFVAGGDHTVVLATVAAADTSGLDALTYYRRRFGSAGDALPQADAVGTV